MKNKMILALMAIISLLCQSAYGQNKITLNGILVDSASLYPITGVIMNLHGTNGTLYNSNLTQNDGIVKWSNIRPDKYRLSVTAVGYVSKSFPVDLSKSKNDTLINLGYLKLSKAIVTLNEITIRANKPLITQGADRIVYNLQADPESKFQNTFDLLRKVPLVSITADDQIQLKGNSNFKVLINGRTSALVVGNPRDVFKVMPANMIDRIEIITIPPAKYDSEGLAGIINLVTKSNNFRGFVGGVDLNYGKLNSGGNGHFSLNYGKLGLSGVLGNFNENPPESFIKNTQIAANNPGYSLDQNGDSKIRSHSYIYNLRINYEIDSLDVVSAAYGGRVLTNNNNGSQQTSIYNNNVNQFYDILKAGHSRNTGNSFDINYELGFRKSKKQFLTFSYNYSNSINNRNATSDPLKTENFPLEILNQATKATLNEQSGQIDYQQPLGKKTDMSIGVKYIRRNNLSNYESLTVDSMGLQPMPDPSNSDTFSYLQKIYSAYNSYTLNLNGYNISAGARFEKTTNEGNGNTEISLFRNGFVNFVPTLAVQKNIGPNNGISFGFTQRIQRPSIYQLNPFIDKTDPSYYFQGNPYLKPVVNNTFSLDFNTHKKGFINLGISYSFANNTIQRAVVLRSDTLSLSSYYNVGKNKELNFSMNINYPITSKLDLSVNGLITYVRIKGQIDGQLYSNEGAQGNGYLYLTYRFKGGWSASINGGYYSSVIILQGKSNPYFYSSVSINKSLLKNKLFVFAAVTNPFNKYRTSRNSINNDEVLQQFETRSYVRNYNLGLSYNFGKMNGPAAKKVKKSIKNEDLIQNKNDEEKGKP